MRLTPKRINPIKLRLAREFRRGLTIAERKVWDLVRNRRLLGFKFRRQHVIDGFVVDFYCPELKLVLELDGAGHAELDRLAYDAARTEHLEMKGLLVARLRNNEVSEERLNELVRKLSDRPPSPRSGEGDRG
jgi:very-short-patch-repair endonuclease